MRRLGAILLLSVPTAVFAADIGGYVETTLVTNTTDTNLINPWGVAFSSSSPFWVSDQGSGVTTVYTGTTNGTPALTVAMPAGSSGVTGQVFSGGTSFNGDSFIFATLQGTITGWRTALGGTAETLFPAAGGSYTGLAISSDKSTLYAANFGAGTIDVFNNGGKTGSFSDAAIPAGYAPYNIQNIGGQLYVEYALKGSNGHAMNGAGNGFVATFNPSTGTFSTLISQGVLNSPWGITIAPSAGFGALSGDLLVGNFGDGLINAFTPGGAFIGTLADVNSNPIENGGLWSLTFGNGGKGGLTTTLYVTAGPNNETGGLFAAIATPEPGTAALAVAGGLALLMLRRRHAARR